MKDCLIIRKNFYYLLKVIILIFALSFSNLSAQNPGDNVFSGIKVFTIKIKMTQNNYWDSLVYYYNQGLEHYMNADVEIDGTLLKNVGIRLKGNASYSHPNNKKPIRLSFDEFDEDQRWDGLKGIHLNNCWNDPTFMRENLQLWFCQEANIPAPRSNYAFVYINDIVWGLYSMVEHVNKTFLSSRYGNSSGNLYKAVDAFGGAGGGTTKYMSDFKWYGSDSNQYTIRYELKTDESTNRWGELISFLDMLNNTSDLTNILPEKLNTTNFYRAIATDILFANMDSYTDSGRNFYFYFNPKTKKLEWIVWDVNMNFGLYKGGASNALTISLTYTSSTTNRPLVGKVFTNSTLKAEYYRQFYKIFTNYFIPEKLFARIDSITPIIRPYVNLDTRKQYTLAQFDANITSNITVTGGGFGGETKLGLKYFITNRKTNVESQFKALGIDLTYKIGKGDVVINEFMANNKTILDPNGEYADWIELYNNSNENYDLSNTYLSNDKSNLLKWKLPEGTSIPKNGYLIIWADNDLSQTGLHSNFDISENGGILLFSNSDGSIIDSISYGTQKENISFSRIPNGSGDFVQTKPTPNMINSIGSIQFQNVVINEFMSQNSTTIADPSGQYDDWIELYNNTNSEIDLSGCYLSDSYSNTTKWSFPSNTKIPAKGYLLIWADEDSAQEGLHAMFKLSASGEQIILSNPDLTVIDSVKFGSQATDKSMARIPNGTGLFKQVQIATPGKENTDNTTSIKNTEKYLPTSYVLNQNYPNPFNPATNISFSLPKDSYVKLEIFNILGQHICTLIDNKLSAGNHTISWKPKKESTGLYLYKLTAKDSNGESFTQVKKMLYMK